MTPPPTSNSVLNSWICLTIRNAEYMLLASNWIFEAKSYEHPLSGLSSDSRHNDTLVMESSQGDVANIKPAAVPGDCGGKSRPDVDL
jgi:hypothetical protein